MKQVKCPICGNLINDDTFTYCPYCEWGYVAYEEELEPDEKEPFNLMSISHARAMFKKGLTTHGNKYPKTPIPRQ